MISSCPEYMLCAIRRDKDRLSIGRNLDRVFHLAAYVFPAALNVPAWYFAPKGQPSHADFEALVGRAVTEKSLKKGEFTMENTVMEMKEFSLMMKIMYKTVEAIIARGFGKKKDYDNPEFCMMMSSAADCSLSGMKINGRMNNRVMEGMLKIANGHPLRGIAEMMKK